jgi:hypothetical protein
VPYLDRLEREAPERGLSRPPHDRHVEDRAQRLPLARAEAAVLDLAVAEPGMPAEDRVDLVQRAVDRLSTRAISRTEASIGTTCSKTWLLITRSKLPSSNGSRPPCS